MSFSAEPISMTIGSCSSGPVMTTKQNYPEIREAVAKLCARFPGEYWRDLDRRMAYPSEFVGVLTQAGWLSVLIPEEYGGGRSATPPPPRGAVGDHRRG